MTKLPVGANTLFGRLPCICITGPWAPCTDQSKNPPLCYDPNKQAKISLDCVLQVFGFAQISNRKLSFPGKRRNFRQVCRIKDTLVQAKLTKRNANVSHVRRKIDNFTLSAAKL